MRPTIFVEAKFEARLIFKTMPKFGVKANLRPKEKAGQTNREARPNQIFDYAKKTYFY